MYLDKGEFELAKEYCQVNDLLVLTSSDIVSRAYTCVCL